MLCRTSKLIHPSSGASLETPLLVPSFSSKAFGFGRDGEPEVLQVLKAAQEFITRTCLVSAYDVHYNYIPDPYDLEISVDLIFLDSDAATCRRSRSRFIDQRNGMLQSFRLSGAGGQWASQRCS